MRACQNLVRVKVRDTRACEKTSRLVLRSTLAPSNNSSEAGLLLNGQHMLLS